MASQQGVKLTASGFSLCALLIQGCKFFFELCLLGLNLCNFFGDGVFLIIQNFNLLRYGKRLFFRGQYNHRNLFIGLGGGGNGGSVCWGVAVGCAAFAAVGAVDGNTRGGYAKQYPQPGVALLGGVFEAVGEILEGDN